MFAAAATVPSLRLGFAADAGGAAMARAVAADQQGYGTDPELMKEWRAGGAWPLTLTETGRQTTQALCDLIIPADAHSPAASAVGVVDFIDEWISAPYPQQRGDREIILSGLAWIESEAQKRHAKAFAALADSERASIADDICSVAKARPEFAVPAKFFAKFRDLTAGGFYTTPVGMKDIGYVGNTPLAKFEGPPLEALRKAGLA
jgi:hypothetical protein